MKTDLERFIELYKSFGIECKVNKTNKDQYILFVQQNDYDKYENRETRSEKFDGYYCFHSDITFDLDGKFIKQGFWE